MKKHDKITKDLKKKRSEARKAHKEKMDKLKEKAKTDSHKKYNYPGGDVDMKIEINKAAQDHNEEVNPVEEARRQETFCN